ncbi:MAG TPA: acyl-CoA dehydrogenase family protein [Streptomyces sp.]|nr:acyl-CoA dehydrogenase family protein [Streptomyces sp.]
MPRTPLSCSSTTCACRPRPCSASPARLHSDHASTPPGAARHCGVGRCGDGAALAETVAYTKSREAFGGTLFDLQNTRFVLAECATLVRVARTFVDDCILKHLHGELDNKTASMAKYWTTDTQGQVVDKCQQLFGGYGSMWEYPITRMAADGRVQRIYGGANELIKELIARSL